MIDDELHRQANLKEYEKEWTEKNRAAIFHRIETDFVNTQEPDAKEFQMYQRDTKLARRDPERYCADRCITTGNCDVFEGASLVQWFLGLLDLDFLCPS